MVGARPQGRSKFRNVCRVFVAHRSWLGGRGVREAGQGLGGVQGLRFRGGRRQRHGVQGVLSFLTRQKKEKWLFLKEGLWGGGAPPELAWWTGGSGRRGKGSGGCARASVPGQKEEKWRFLKDAEGLGCRRGLGGA